MCKFVFGTQSKLNDGSPQAKDLLLVQKLKLIAPMYFLLTETEKKRKRNENETETKFFNNGWKNSKNSKT